MKRYLRVILFVGVLLAASALPASASSHKIVICHKGKTISVATSSLAAHQAHGDTLGACNAGVGT